MKVDERGRRQRMMGKRGGGRGGGVECGREGREGVRETGRQKVMDGGRKERIGQMKEWWKDIYVGREGSKLICVCY